MPAVGITQVTVAVRNPARPTRLWEALFLVDTGAIDCLVPAKQLRALGLKPRGKRTYQLADGSEVTLRITVAEIEFMGETVGATVIYGPDDAEPILGVTALESVGIEVDPRSQRLKRFPTVRLKAGRVRRANGTSHSAPAFARRSLRSWLRRGRSRTTHCASRTTHRA
jgi:clan AA aspartic protease